MRPTERARVGGRGNGASTARPYLFGAELKGQGRQRRRVLQRSERLHAGALDAAGAQIQCQGAQERDAGTGGAEGGEHKDMGQGDVLERQEVLTRVHNFGVGQAEGKGGQGGGGGEGAELARRLGVHVGAREVEGVDGGVAVKVRHEPCGAGGVGVAPQVAPLEYGPQPPAHAAQGGGP